VHGFLPPAPFPLPQPKVSIRIEDIAVNRESILANAFTYTEPARVTLALTPVAESTGPATGVLSVSASSKSKATIGRVAFTFVTEPAGAVTWGAIEPGAAANVQNRTVTSAAGTEGALHIAIGAPRSGHGAGELVTVPWAFTGDTESVTVEITNARVATDDGYPLQIDAATLQLR